MTSSGGARTSTGTYVRLCEIASGGMGTVELAMRREGTFRRLFAIKRLLANFRDDHEVRGMFLDEARIAGLLRHPNAVSVVDVGEDEAGPFLVMEYVEGLSLSSMLSRIRQTGEQVDVQVCARLVAQCAHGLHAAHELRGHDGTWLRLVHRDVSPQNILVGFDGIVRLTDFGIAKAAGRATRTSTGLLKGKLSYMAPEQLRFEEPDRRSDLFALGVVCFELVAGARLFKAETPRDAARKILNEDAPDVRTIRADVPEAMAVLLRDLLSRDPERRPAEAASVALRLEEIAAALAAGEGAKDVGAFMRARFDDARQESARRISDTIQSVESERDVRIGSIERSGGAIEVPISVADAGPTLATPVRRRPRVLAAVAIAAIAVAGAISGALAWAGGESAPVVAAPPQPVAPPQAVTGGEAPSEAQSEAQSEAESEAPSEAGSAPETDLEPAAEASAEAEPAVGADDAERPGARARTRGTSERTSTRRRTKRWDWE